MNHFLMFLEGKNRAVINRSFEEGLMVVLK